MGFFCGILLLLQVPCRMAWAIMDLHFSLSLQLWITSQLLSSFNQPLMLSSCFILCLPLSLVPSILPVVINSSMFPSLTICPKNFICCSLIPFCNSYCQTHDFVQINIQNKLIHANQNYYIGIVWSWTLAWWNMRTVLQDIGGLGGDQWQ